MACVQPSPGKQRGAACARVRCFSRFYTRREAATSTAGARRYAPARRNGC